MNKIPIGRPIPVGTIPATAQNKPLALPAPEPSSDDQWLEFVHTAWQLALMPALTWTAYAASSWRVWENAWARYWPTRYRRL